MKKLVLLFAIILYGLCPLKAQLVDVIVEEFGTDIGGLYPSGYTTYRVYARLQDPSDFLSTVYGIGAAPQDPNHTLTLGAWPDGQNATTIWNSSFGGITGPDINPAFCAIFPETCYDSFVTIGRASSTTPGNAINILTTPAGELNPGFSNSAAAGVPVYIDDGAWFALSGDVNGFPSTPDNRVLILQMTVPTGTLAYAINIQIFDDGVGANSLYYAHTLEGPVGEIGGQTEGDFTCLGLVYPEPPYCSPCDDPLACNYNPNSVGTSGCAYAEDCETLYGCLDDEACNFSAVALFSDGSCDYTCIGCADPLACNYNTLATIDDGSCLYNDACWGCLDTEAVNYDEIALWEDGSCQYTVSAIVYYDTNGNGNWEYDEPGLEGWSAYVPEVNATLFTDENGYFYLAEFAPGDYTLQLISTNPDWTNTTPLTQTVTVPNSFVAAEFGFIPAGSEALFEVNTFSSVNILGCLNGVDAGIWLENDGAVPLNGTFTLTFDPELTVSITAGVEAPDEIGAGYATWNILNQPVGVGTMYAVHVNGPGFEDINQTFDFVRNLTLNDGGDEYYNNTWSQYLMVACSYDPNDKQAVPIGYEEPHFILGTERIEYTIRFQNTGNYPAEDILITDQLDMSVLDISTFELNYGSLPFYTCLHDDGLLEFMFVDVFLPDSVNNEPESHGLVTFSIEPLDNLPPGTVINNTAEIYFDQNPAVVTNTTYHTIFDCESFSGITGDLEYCEGENTVLSAEQDYVESYTWFVGGEEYGSESMLALDNLPAETYSVEVFVENPLCGITHAEDLIVHETPEVNAGDDQELCLNETVILEASSTAGDNFTWNNGLGEGSQQIFEAETTTTYEVSVSTEFGCSDTDEVMVVVNDLPGISITQNGGVLTAPDGETWQWFLGNELIDNATSQEFVVLEDGIYSVITTNEFGCFSQSEEVFVVGIKYTEQDGFSIYPNPANDLLNVLAPEGTWVIKMYNSIGQEVFVRTSVLGSTMTIDVSTLLSGSYQMLIVGSEKSLHHKIIIN